MATSGNWKERKISLKRRASSTSTDQEKEVEKENNLTKIRENACKEINFNEEMQK